MIEHADYELELSDIFMPDDTFTEELEETFNAYKFLIDTIDSDDTSIGMEIEIPLEETAVKETNHITPDEIDYANVAVIATTSESVDECYSSGSEYEIPDKHETNNVYVNTDSYDSSESSEEDLNNNEKEHNKSNYEQDIHSYAKGAESLKESKVYRKRKRDPSSWQQNVRKRQRNRGEQYVNAKGKRIPMRVSKQTNCKCKFKCNEKFDQKNRESIFHTYWKKDYQQQKIDIVSNVDVIDKKRQTTGKVSRRKSTYQYFLPLNGDRSQVCKAFFCNTLDVGERTIRYNVNRSEPFDTQDYRGRHKKRVITEDEKNIIRNHINQFPTVASHYCCKDIQRKYLDKNLTLQKMFDLYCIHCSENNIQAQKFWLYEQIFNFEFNLGFHRPKKDLCSFCESFKILSEPEKAQKISEYEAHQERKQDARTQKTKDIAQAKTDKRTRVLNFDLQKVLISPKTEIGEAYYSRKLATYNLSIFDVVSKEVSCYMWHGTIAKRGSNAIASCLLDYNKQLGEVDNLIYYSDSCTGQQRNISFTTMCMYSVQTLPIKRITHNYFERGHSQMEGDSVHARIELYTKKSDMFSPIDWKNAVRNCKTSKPKYKVIEVSNSDILDFKSMAIDTIGNRKKSTDGSLVKWNKTHSFQYLKETPDSFFYRYDHRSEYRCCEIAREHMRRKRVKAIENYQLKKAYKGPIPIATAKYKDLMKLCKARVIPQSYHSFYELLPHGDKTVMMLPEPNESDTSDDE